jgi:hypothetical protein
MLDAKEWLCTNGWPDINDSNKSFHDESAPDSNY